MAVFSRGLLVFTTLLLQVALSVDDPSSCRASNYQHACRGDVCELFVTWRKEGNSELSLLVSSLVPEHEEHSWSTTITISRAPIEEARFTCQWINGETSHTCSLSCLAANITYHNHQLACRFTIEDGEVFSELTSAPVSLLISNSSAVGGGSGQQGVGPECLCDIRDCLDSCDSCTTGAGGDGDQCHSVLSLLLIRSHAILMVLTFLLLVPTGITISRYSRPVFPYSWFRAHAAINTASLTLTLLGLAAVLGHTRGKFTAGLHQVVGILCISLLLFQALCGYFRPAAGVSLQRRVFNSAHRINGAAVLLIGTAAMVLGSVIYHNSVYPLVSLVLALALAVELVFFLTLEVIMRRNYMVSVPVGYQKVEGGDGEEEGEGEGGGEKGQELCVMNGTTGGVKDNGTTSKRNAKHSQPHTATKRLLDAFAVQAFLFSLAIGVLIMYGSH